jgi:MscS family membrane protein
MKFRMPRICLSLFLLLGFLSCVVPMAPACATAALLKGGEKPAETEALPVDELGRSTPRGTVVGFLDAIAKQDFIKASQYLDLAKIPESTRTARGEELAKDLQALLDKGGWFFPSSMISNDRDGKKDEEGIEEGLDQIGQLQGNKGAKIAITAQQVEVGGNKIWLISSATLEQLRGLTESVADSEPLINTILPNFLIDTKWFGAPAGHWIAVLALLALSYLSCWFVALALFGFLKKVWTKKCSVSGTHLLDAVRVPISLYASVWLFAYSSLWVGISFIVRQSLSQLNIIVAWSAIALLLWRLIDIVTSAAQKKMTANGRFFGFSSILFFFRRMIKIVFGVVLLFIVLDNLGVDVTAGLAALGIGGIALALGAQKTLENFIGSLAIVIDQPLHIGDYCKIGDAAGTVEDIGMRSTRLRTNERTLITIPNGDLSNQRIENLARRNRYLVHKKFQLRYDATSEQIRLFLKKAEEIFFANEYVTEEGLPVRYLGPGSDGHMIELFLYVNVSDVNDYLRVQQDLMLQMTDLIGELGLYYIIPSQTMLPAVDQRGNEAGVHAAPQAPIKV